MHTHTHKQIATKVLITLNPVADLYKTFSRYGLRLATAESCTGGLVGGLLTSQPGISSVYVGGFVTYTNEMKTELLGVDPATIAQYTEVSARVAMQMAQGARERTGADIAISLTGVAGPGGTADKPAGLVYISASFRGKTVVTENHFDGTRSDVREKAANKALEMAIELIKNS